MGTFYLIILTLIFSLSLPFFKGLQVSFSGSAMYLFL